MTSRREFVQLAQTYNPRKHPIGGWYVSEKLDGMRAYWDGGWSRGKPCSEVPYANTAKDYRRTTPAVATGLWSRYGKAVFAPDSFLDSLPENIPLDGELYLGPGQFQTLISIVKRFDPDPAKWAHIHYMVFDIPSDYMMFQPGKIKNPNHEAEFFDMRSMFDQTRTRARDFHTAVHVMNNSELDSDVVHIHKQIILPSMMDAAQEQIAEMLEKVTDDGGEGLILRKPSSIWQPRRTWDMLKVKPYLDSEATIIGYKGGKGHLEGLMGALIVSWQGLTFDLRGSITREQSQLYGITDSPYMTYPDEVIVASQQVHNPHFPIGSEVHFRYRETTDDGYPKEARAKPR